MTEKSEILPIGTVCILKNIKKKIMIIGYLSRLQKFPNKINDYLGCLYPEGIISTDKNLLFNRSDIEKVIFKGLIDEEYNSVVDKIESIKKNNKLTNYEVDVQQNQEKNI